MQEILTFSQCLTRLMQQHQYTTATLSSLLGARAELRRILSDDSTDAKRQLIYEKITKSDLFSAEECMQLANALEVSRIGIENFKFQLAIRAILNGEPRQQTPAMKTEGGKTLESQLVEFQKADEIEILMINSCFHSVVAALLPLFQVKELPIRMKHLIHSDAFANTASSFVAVVFPLLFDHRYQPYGMERRPDTENHAIGGNMLAIRASFGKEKRERMFVITNDSFVHEMPNASASTPFAFLSTIIDSLSPAPFHLKESSGTAGDFASLCMNFLSHELNRGTYSIANDLCFQQTPSDIIVAALRDKALLPPEEIEMLINRAYAIHEQRYQNQYSKKKPAYRIMTLEGCRSFLKTGRSTDHFFAIRPYTPEERKTIFGNMLQAAKQNPYFIPLLIKNKHFKCRYNIVCYDKLGISLDLTDTDYDIEKGYHSVFLVYPEFTKQYMEYYLNTVVPVRCYSANESLALLEELYSTFLEENHLIE